MTSVETVAHIYLLAESWAGHGCDEDLREGLSNTVLSRARVKGKDRTEGF